MKGNLAQAIKILGITAFTYEGAARAYQKCVKHFADHMSLEASAALADAADVLHSIGYTWEQIEEIEIAAY